MRRLEIMAGERLDPGRRARSCVAVYRIKEVGVVAGEERNGLSRTPPPSLETEDMLDADDDERRDLDDDDNDDDDGEEKPRWQDSMKAKESSRSWNWS